MNAEFFRSRQWHVESREYGTPVYHEMFTLTYADYPMFEIRRCPKSAKGRTANGVLDERSTHIRLVNRMCYTDDAAKVMLDFLQQYGYENIRISRLDICCDFVKFDSGDDPNKFLQRYMRGKYTKINQANVHAHGIDRWDGRNWNSVSWGSKKSSVSTKMYNKTLELEQGRDKPYIRYAWYMAGLIDDPFLVTKTDEAGNTTKPNIWRIEFSLQSARRNWLEINQYDKPGSAIRSLPHRLELYTTREALWNMFAALANHYFHFKKYRHNLSKYECEDKALFDYSSVGTFYKMTIPQSSTPKKTALVRLYHRIKEFSNSTSGKTFEACDTLLEELERRMRLDDLVTPFSMKELTLMRQLLALRYHSKNVGKEELEQMFDEMNIFDDTEFFGER